MTVTLTSRHDLTLDALRRGNASCGCSKTLRCWFMA
jgi:hypothetical protein